MKRRTIFIFLVTLTLAIFWAFKTKDSNTKPVNLSVESTTEGNKLTEKNNNTNRQPANIPKPSKNIIEKIKAENKVEEESKQADLSKEAEIFKELTDLNSSQFIEDIKAIEVFDKELAAELREDLNLKPSDLDEMQPEYTEQIEVDYDSFDVNL